MELVEVRRNEVYCDSYLVARKMGLQHFSVATSIKKLVGDLEELSPIGDCPKMPIKVQRHYRGTDYTAYLMTREFFSLLAMRFKGQKALKWQIKFNNAFYMMERRLLQVGANKNDPAWIDSRNQGKIARKEETDVIKQFVEYATKQGSNNARHYYSNITRATYKALGLISQHRPKLRDEMNIYQMAELLLAERLARNSLSRYMESGKRYKDIYQLVVDDLLSFAGSIRIECYSYSKTACNTAHNNIRA